MAAITNLGKVPLVLLILTIISISYVSSSTDQETQQDWAKTVSNGKENETTLRFYFHDIWSGKKPSAVKVVGPSNASASATDFGSLAMADDLLTTGPEPTSKPVGRAQGLYGVASRDEVGLIMAVSYSFNDGMYNGSSVSILGRNMIMHPVRELPVVGGTGVFRMARGYALAHTLWYDTITGDAVVGYNITLIHP